MSFLKRLWRLGGCSRLQGEAVLPLEDGDEEAEAAGAGDHCFECLEAGHVLTDLHYVPWTSPGVEMPIFNIINIICQVALLSDESKPFLFFVE